MSTANDIVVLILDRLFDPTRKTLARMQDKMIEDHYGLKATYQHLGLKFVSAQFLHSSTPAQKRGMVNTFEQLTDEDADTAQSYLNLKSTLEEDFTIVRQGLVSLLGGMKSEGNFRNALPEWLVKAFFPQLVANYERTAEPGYSIKDRPGGELRFEKLDRKMKGYYALQMVL